RSPRSPSSRLRMPRLTMAGSAQGGKLPPPSIAGTDPSAPSGAVSGHNPESPVPIRTRNAPAEAVTLPRGRRGSTLAASVLRFDLALLRTAFAEAGRLADPVAKIVQLRPANTSVPLDDDIGDLGGVHREGPLDSFAGHNAANRE